MGADDSDENCFIHEVWGGERCNWSCLLPPTAYWFCHTLQVSPVVAMSKKWKTPKPTWYSVLQNHYAKSTGNSVNEWIYILVLLLWGTELYFVPWDAYRCKSVRPESAWRIFSGNEGSLMGWRLELKGKIWVMFTTLFLFQIAVFLGK